MSAETDMKGHLMRVAGIVILILTLSETVAGAQTNAGPTCRALQASAGRAIPQPPTLDRMPSGLPFDGTLDENVVTALDTAFDTAYRATRAKTMAAAIGIPGKGMWMLQRETSRPLFYWASVGKQAIAVIILQLAEEGKLKLSDHVSKWIDNVPNGDRIQIAHLLSHTSGLVGASDDAQTRVHAGQGSDAGEMEGQRARGPFFEPGQCWHYSNSGYDLLGRIIEKADGRPWRQAIAARIIRPLNLRHMRAVEPGEANADVAPTAAMDGEPALDIAVPGAAGPLVASPDDIIRFEQAIFDGRLLTPQSRSWLFRKLYRMFDPGMYYGLGIMLYDVPDEPRRLFWIGHSGGAPGLSAVVAYDLSRAAFVAVAVNGGGDAHAAANLLLKSLDHAGR
jgi:D-alanyl-D-alanine carboxypeptidase